MAMASCICASVHEIANVENARSPEMPAAGSGGDGPR